MAKGKLTQAVEDLGKVTDLNARLLEMDADDRVRLLRKENKALRERLRSRDSGWEVVRAALDQAFDEPLDLRIAKPIGRKPRRTIEEGVLHWTDIHFGKETATYNSTIAAERVDASTEAAIEIIELRRSFANIDTLHVCLGGDLPEGEGEIFPSQAHEIDQGLIEQMIRFGPEVMARNLLRLAQVVKKLKVRGVPGNHGRFSKNNARRTNADSICYEVIRRMVSMVPGMDERIEWDLPLDRPAGNEWYSRFDVCERWGVMLVHGDQIRGQLGFPWYGWGKKASGWSQVFSGIDFIFGGHWHTDAAFDLNHIRIFSTGSTESDNAYAKENMAAAGSPKQRLCFFNKKWGLLADHPIHLTEGKQ